MKYRAKFSVEGEISFEARSEEDARLMGEAMVREIDPAKFNLDLEVEKKDELEQKMAFDEAKDKMASDLQGDDFKCSYCGSEGAKFCKARTSPLAPAFVCQSCCTEECPIREKCNDPIWRD